MILFGFFFSQIYPDISVFYSNIVTIAKNSQGLSDLPGINGRHFNNDCVGFVKYVYFKCGVDLDKVSLQNGNNGVALLYGGLLNNNSLYSNKNIQLGDIIFFDNTYDINNNGLWDDPLTHIGILTRIGRHNTISYTHYASGEVKEYAVNLDYPDTHAFKQRDGGLYIINSHLRRERGEGYERKEYVSSSFYRSFAHIRVKVKG